MMCKINISLKKIKKKDMKTTYLYQLISYIKLEISKYIDLVSSNIV